MEVINKLRHFLNKNRKLSWIIFSVYIAIFIGCAGFPLFPQHTGYANLLIHLGNAVYVIPLTFVALLGKSKPMKVYSISFVSLLLGMVCRYALEFGELSNSINFTAINVVSFLVLLPLIYVFTYYVYCKNLN